jgi:GNAT superfamily N-acetyltransferase
VHAAQVVAAPEALERDLEQRVLTFWGSVLGVEAGLLDRDGFVVVEDPRDFAARRRASIRTARGTLLLPAPGEKQVAVAAPADYAADVAARARAVGLLHYRATPPAGDRDPRVRLLDAADRPLLDALQAAAGADASEEAEVDVEHPLAVGIVEGGRLLAIATLLEEAGGAADVGVLVHPAERGGGLGTAVVREATDRATRAERLVQYRCNRENEASAGLARACGFMLWGVLSVAPQPEPRPD